MSLEDDLIARSGGSCELCKSNEQLSVCLVSDAPSTVSDASIYACKNCSSQIDGSAPLNADHWQVLSETMWSEAAAVQVTAWRMLDRLKSNTWASDLFDMLYLDDENLAWAKAGLVETDENAIQHFDCNGSVLAAGDTVTLIKDLNVKGTSFTAKRGTAVRRISLVHDNAEHIEGRANNQQIVILTKFVKKSS